MYKGHVAWQKFAQLGPIALLPVSHQYSILSLKNVFQCYEISVNSWIIKYVHWYGPLVLKRQGV